MASPGGRLCRYSTEMSSPTVNHALWPAGIWPSGVILMTCFDKPLYAQKHPDFGFQIWSRFELEYKVALSPKMPSTGCANSRHVSCKEERGIAAAGPLVRGSAARS